MAKKTKKFKTEVQQLLDLVIHSLYSKKEIYLRELVSNSSDAMDRRKFEALTDPSLIADDPEYKIKITPDKEAKTIVISDTGIGMNADEVEANIGTIASSGTKSFMASMAESEGGGDAEMIGQFGVGFYASFMVADKVSVLTKRAGEGQTAIRWVSEGAGDYTLEEAEKDEPGTEVTLHLRDGMDEFLEEWEIRKTVKSYSDYISYPVVMDIERSEPAEEEGGEPTVTIEEETLNSMKALWKRPKSEITDEDYTKFYQHIAKDFTDPLKTIHYVAEGATEFRALMFIPSQAPMDLFMRDTVKSLQLFVRGVFITDDCKELIPDYLRFVKGVVESSDLPLNVSREMLQDDHIISVIRKSVVSKVLGTLKDLKEQNAADYQTFYTHFGAVLKEGAHIDFENAEKLQNLLLFHTSKTDGETPISMQDYVDRMVDGQTDIYFMAADSLAAAKSSPHLEALAGKDYEVLFMVDPIDEWVIQSMPQFAEKPLVAADRGDLELDTDEEKEEKAEEREASAKEYKDLLEHIKEALKDDVKEVKLSNRLTESACCLVADPMGMNANMERIMKAMNQETLANKRILELNPSHPVLTKMKELFDANKDDELLGDYIRLLHGQALLTEGSAVKDPLGFTRLVSNLMTRA